MGIFSDKRAVVAFIIAIPLAIIAYVFVKPIDYNLSLIVFGAALVLFLFGCLLDTADEFEKPVKPETRPKEEKKPKPSKVAPVIKLKKRE